MELNPLLVKESAVTYNIIPSASGGKVGVYPLVQGLCHPDDMEVLVNDVPLPKSDWKGILPSSEYTMRYAKSSVSAVLLLNTAIKGTIAIRAKAIGGTYSNINFKTLPTLMSQVEAGDMYVESYGEIVGLDNFNTSLSKLPSRATDIDGILIGRTSYPGAKDFDL